MFKSRYLSRKRAGIYKKDTVNIRKRAGRAGRAGKNSSENKKCNFSGKWLILKKNKNKSEKPALSALRKKTMRKRYYYRVCERCGAHLDPGEVCSCEREEG